ncbi:hypothetical protein RRF57_000166 [Xylaria bambusicola]|uniref:Uncharacterized protein n=1 Tax=Xylaria bambusicola TaxID=326684 RepID=A0AAN7U362_9PEZI
MPCAVKPTCWVYENLLRPLALLLAAAFALRIVREITAATGNLGCDLEEDFAKVVIITIGRRHHVKALLTPIDEVHDDGPTSMSACMLSEVVAARKFLATLVALKRLVLGVKGAIMTLEMFLAAESAVA